MEAFAHADYYLDEAAIRSAYQPPYQFNLIHIPSALKADFWLLRPVSFEREMFSRRLQDTWFGEKIWLATSEYVILHKLSGNSISPSDRQLGDVAGVVQVQRGKLDESYLRHWAAVLDVDFHRDYQRKLRLESKHYEFKMADGRKWPLEEPEKFYRLSDVTAARFKNAGFMADFALATEAMMSRIYEEYRADRLVLSSRGQAMIEQSFLNAAIQGDARIVDRARIDCPRPRHRAGEVAVEIAD
jgi:hypothetical protein